MKVIVIQLYDIHQLKLTILLIYDTFHVNILNGNNLLSLKESNVDNFFFTFLWKVFKV